jgi:hypothetical protein
MEEEGNDEQSGFRANRGTIDGPFTTRIGQQKLKEQKAKTWVLFAGLAKAVDTVSRKELFVVLRRYGLPNHLININNN